MARQVERSLLAIDNDEFVEARPKDKDTDRRGDTEEEPPLLDSSQANERYLYLHNDTNCSSCRERKIHNA